MNRKCSRYGIYIDSLFSHYFVLFGHYVIIRYNPLPENNRTTQEQTMNEKQLAIVAYDNCLASSITLPCEMLNAAFEANAVQQKEFRDTRQTGTKIYAARKKVTCAGQVVIHSDTHPRELHSPDLVILPAIWRNPLSVIKRERYLLDLLRGWDSNGSLICAVGSSSGFLAEAGLLENKAATTHWSQMERFRRRYAQVAFKTDFLITQSGNIFCASSVNSVADLMIYFIQELFNADIAKKVEANFSPEIRKPYSSSLFRQGHSSRHTDEDIIRLQHWLHENFKQAVTATEMANMLGMSTRTLNRRFKHSLDRTPIEYITQLKIDHARELLKHSNLSNNEIAMECGFNNASYFSNSFKKANGTSPSNYRKMVKAKLFSTPG